MFNVHTVNRMQYSEQICCNSIIKLDRNHAMKQIHTRNTLKTQQFALIEKKLFGPQQTTKETRKQGRKANRINTLDGGNDKNVELQISEKSITNASHKITAETTKRIYMKNLPTLRNDSSIVGQDH